MNNLSGQVIKGYELREQLGAGGFGAVYRAYQPLVKREVAIKVILPEYANDPDFIRRFEVEAQTVARLEHLYIVPLYDYWREPGGAYLVMRLLHNSLRHELKNGPLTLATVTHLLDQVAAGLMVAHRQGVIHRDLKPDNILLDNEGNAYLADFGIAKDIRADKASSTEAGVLIGSPTYLSPEQIKDEAISPQSDIYSLGIMLYELLVGQQPFADTMTPMAVISRQLNDSLPLIHLQRPDIPIAITGVLQRATEKRPADRYPEVLSLAAAFRQAANAPQSSTSDTLKFNQPAVFTPRDTEISAFNVPTSHTMPSNIEQLVSQVKTPPNPYKGLRAFQEPDASDFFGREDLTDRLTHRLAEKSNLAHFLAVIGPSGSGKSSVVRAGLIPALRRGAVTGSKRWYIIEMLPGPHPLEELEAALLRIAINPPASLLSQLQEDERGLARAIKRILPPRSTNRTPASDRSIRGSFYSAGR